MWLVAAGLSAMVTLAFRDYSVWHGATLVASGVAAILGIFLIWRPSGLTILASTIGGVVWFVMYVVLMAIQSDDFQAWSADAFLAILGAAAAILAIRAGRRPAET